jgi:hypothetical protein
MTLRSFCAVVALIFVVNVPTVHAQCTATITPTTVSVSSIGSSSALSVITGQSCSWTATSDVSWITITFATGAGLGQVQYTVAANPLATSRVGVITVAGHTVTVTQAANSCSYTVMPTTVTVPANGSAATLSVTSGTSCSWSATTTASWITITAGATGSGIGAVSFTVPASTAARTGTLTVAGRTVTVTQGGPAPSAPLPPTNLRIIR